MPTRLTRRVSEDFMRELEVYDELTAALMFRAENMRLDLQNEIRRWAPTARHPLFEAYEALRLQVDRGEELYALEPFIKFMPKDAQEAFWKMWSRLQSPLNSLRTFQLLIASDVLRIAVLHYNAEASDE